MPKISLANKKKMCSGCRNNRYNQPAGFRETENDVPVTGEGCWSLKDAVVVKKRLVSYSQRPPWKQSKSKYLSCYSMPGYIITDKEN